MRAFSCRNPGPELYELWEEGVLCCRTNTAVFNTIWFFLYVQVEVNAPGYFLVFVDEQKSGKGLKVHTVTWGERGGVRSSIMSLQQAAVRRSH